MIIQSVTCKGHFFSYCTQIHSTHNSICHVYLNFEVRVATVSHHNIAVFLHIIHFFS